MEVGTTGTFRLHDLSDDELRVIAGLRYMYLNNNGLGSAGLIALAPGLRALPQLKKLGLVNNRIDDDGVAALVEPGEGVLPSLEELWLDSNQVTEAGCAALVAALSPPHITLSCGNTATRPRAVAWSLSSLTSAFRRSRCGQARSLVVVTDTIPTS